MTAVLMTGVLLFFTLMYWLNVRAASQEELAPVREDLRRAIAEPADECESSGAS